MREFSNEIKKYDIYCYEISSDSTNIKNNAILKAGNTRPTKGTKIAGKNELVI